MVGNSSEDFIDPDKGQPLKCCSAVKGWLCLDQEFSVTLSKAHTFITEECESLRLPSRTQRSFSSYKPIPENPWYHLDITKNHEGILQPASLTDDKLMSGSSWGGSGLDAFPSTRESFWIEYMWIFFCWGLTIKRIILDWIHVDFPLLSINNKGFIYLKCL